MSSDGVQQVRPNSLLDQPQVNEPREPRLSPKLKKALAITAGVLGSLAAVALIYATVHMGINHNWSGAGFTNGMQSLGTNLLVAAKFAGSHIASGAKAIWATTAGKIATVATGTFVAGTATGAIGHRAEAKHQQALERDALGG